MQNNNLGKFFGPSFSYAGYVFIGCAIFVSFYSLLALTLLIPGFFIAYTYNGTLIDTDKKRVKSYTSLFGIIRTGNWVSTDHLTRFSVRKSTKVYTTRSQANLRNDMVKSDIELLMMNKSGSKKIVLNKFKNPEDAHKEMEKLSGLLLPEYKTDLPGKPEPS